jgi:hypothetical protein
MPENFASERRNISFYFALLFALRIGGLFGNLVGRLGFDFSDNHPAALRLLQLARNSSVSCLDGHLGFDRTTLRKFTTLKRGELR